MKSYLFIVLFIAASCLQMTAQDGQFDVRLVQDHTDYENNTVMVRIDVKATSAASTFYISDQNYRFTFNKEALANPRVGNSLLSGLVSTSSPATTSFFAPHTVHGSKGHIVSYNVVLEGGQGFPLTEATWVPVGMVAFDIVDLSTCADLRIHTKSADFPPTFIGEKYSDHLFESAEGNYTNLNFCFEKEAVVTDVSEPLEETEVKGFNVYPNPALAGTSVTIAAPMAIKQIKLMDVVGKMIDVRQVNLSTAEATYDLNERIIPGVYFLEVTIEDQRVLVDKVVIR